MDVASLTEAFAEDVQDTDNFYQRIVSSDEEDFGDPDNGSIADYDGHPVCQTLFCDPRDMLDTVKVDSVTGGFAEKLPDTDNINHELVSSDDQDFSEPDDGSVEDFERNTWADWCGSAFETAFGAFPQEAANTRPAVMFSNRLFSDEELADMVVLVRRDVPMLPVRRFTDVGVAVIPPVMLLIGLFNGRLTGRSVGTIGWTRSPFCLGRCAIRRFVLMLRMRP